MEGGREVLPSSFRGWKSRGRGERGRGGGDGRGSVGSRGAGVCVTGGNGGGTGTALAIAVEDGAPSDVKVGCVDVELDSAALTAAMEPRLLLLDV